MIYLDYNASVPLRPCAKEAMIAALDKQGNASSPHQSGRSLRALMEGARKEILEGVGAKRLVFTSGGTESNVLALTGLGKCPLIVSAIEHASVLKGGVSPHLLPVTAEGAVDLETLKKLLSSFEAPGLLSIMLVNNETGVIQPLPEVVQLAATHGWKIHTDASQACGTVPFSFEELGVDMMTLSSHKCGGPAGVGALILKENLHLKPLIPGGGQEYGIRSGTLPVPLILGFAAAIKESLSEKDHVPSRLRRYQQKIEKSLPDAIIYGQKGARVAHVVCLGMPKVSAELQLMAFDLKNIAISTGSACSSGKVKQSHVLTAMGIPSAEATCAIRVSMGWNTSEDEIDAFIDTWKNIYHSQKMKEAA